MLYPLSYGRNVRRNLVYLLQMIAQLLHHGLAPSRYVRRAFVAPQREWIPTAHREDAHAAGADRRGDFVDAEASAWSEG